MSDVKPIPGLEHEPYAEVWLRAVDDDEWREASTKARELGKTGLEVWTTTETPEVAPWLEAKGYAEVRRYVISELEVASAPDEPPGIPLVTRRPELEPAMYELALQAYPDQPGRGGSKISAYEGWRGWSVEPHLPEACFIALDGEKVVAYGFLEQGEDHWTHGFMAVERAHRGRGLAGAIKRAQIAWARANGVARLRTATETRLTSMRALNQRLGYVPLYEEIVMRGPAAAR
ncbi:MAG TPA: GNAT family N-acetyltransferase [Gaiellaceae bacterium]|nr:GNAT family N-acetyltransferase [Gaiellaceae bacterium]